MTAAVQPIHSATARPVPVYTFGVARPHPGGDLTPLSSNPAAGTACFRLEPGDGLFEGHFDGAPILPAVAHIALALSAVAHAWSSVGNLTGLRDLRYTRPLGPGDEVEIALTTGRLPTSVRFELRSGGEIASSGLLLFSELTV
jgi:3-hydroxymyristoyl/3-hydroxydecanoyl-(acyl carrier protein) dehydratase